MIVELNISLSGEDKMNMKTVYSGLYVIIALEIFVVLFYFYTIFLDIIAIKINIFSDLTKVGILFTTWVVVSTIFFYIILFLKEINDSILRSHIFSGEV